MTKHESCRRAFKALASHTTRAYMNRSRKKGRYRSGQTGQTVNLLALRLRWFESSPAHSLRFSVDASFRHATCESVKVLLLRELSLAQVCWDAIFSVLLFSPLWPSVAPVKVSRASAIWALFLLC